MNPNPSTAKRIFLEAVEIADVDDRRAFVAAQCGGDDALRRHVEQLFQHYADQGSFLNSPAGSPAATIDLPNTSKRSGEVIGPYKLLQQIGEGGMGTVFMAEQTEPIQRKVALKIIKPGMDSKQVIARFEAERQALAMMDHVNIARVFDGGATEHGRPYFVMELVHGVSITKYCDDNHLTPRERLQLFVPVCQAIQHAHQKGIIHRDVKPSNVMITLYDGKPVPKVIDFGVAKATEQKLTERTLFTQYGAMVGTPTYMSPEQAEMSALGVDTRSDIFSLGVLLYELLTGSTPLTLKRVREAAYGEILRMIREEQAPLPSTRLSDSGEALASISANRHMEPAKLTKLVRGELDWIVMKCLEKDRNRRYETANGIAMDVQRYLTDEPVQACPPSTVYRLRKFVRRHKGAVLAASLLTLALVGGIIGTTYGLVRAEQRAEGERRAKVIAEKRLAQFERGIDLVSSLLADLDPFAEEKEGRPLRAILGDRLDSAAADLEGEAIGDPLVVARLQNRLGQTYLGLGHAAKGEALFTKAVAIRQACLGMNHPDTLTSMHNQALSYERAGKRPEAIRKFKQVHAARLTVLGADHLDTLSTLNELAVEYGRSGKQKDAAKLLEVVRDRRVQLLGEEHEDTLATLQELAAAYRGANRRTEAIDLARKVWEVWVKKHGDDHPRSISAMESLAFAYQAGYKMPQAFALYRQARDKTVPKLGDYHPLTLKILFGLAHMHWTYQELPEAIALFEQVRERQVMILGGYHPATIATLNGLALAHRNSGSLQKALPLFQQAAVGIERLGYSHSRASTIIRNLADCHEQLGQFEAAEVWQRKWVAVAKEKYGPDDLLYVGVDGLLGLGSNLVHQKKYTVAEPILRESLATLARIDPESWMTFRAQALLGGALLGQQKYVEAEHHLVHGFRGMRKTERDKDGRLVGASTRQRLKEDLERVVQFYEVTNKRDELERWRKELIALQKEIDELNKPKPK